MLHVGPKKKKKKKICNTKYIYVNIKLKDPSCLEYICYYAPQQLQNINPLIIQGPDWSHDTRNGGIVHVCGVFPFNMMNVRQIS